MSKPLTKKKWTVMVYLAGDNNLDSAGVVDLNEMKKVGSTDQVNVVAQFDRAGAGRTTNRYYLRKGGSLNKDVVDRLGETNTGDPKVLEAFIKWGANRYPAEHYLVVIWNHGAGWDDTNVYRTARHALRLNIMRKEEIAERAPGRAKGTVSLRRIRTVGGKRFRRALFRTSIEKALTVRAIAFDDNAQDFLDNVEIKRLLASAKKTLRGKVDILGMDACLMSMAEVAYQMRESVSFSVGSEETEPEDGWPYDRILGRLAKRPTMSPKELARTIVNEYLASYSVNEPVTQSAFDLSQSASLGEAVDALARALIGHLSNDAVRSAVLSARYQVQSYEVPDYVDLLDLSKLLRSSIQIEDVSKACQGVLDAATSGGFVLKSGFKGNKMTHSHGVSIYFPTREISPLYAKLDFAKKTAWNEFVAKYLSRLTRRPDVV